MNPPFAQTDPVYWLVYSDYCEDQGKHARAKLCKRIAVGLESTKSLVLVTNRWGRKYYDSDHLDNHGNLRSKYPEHIVWEESRGVHDYATSLEDGQPMSWHTKQDLGNGSGGHPTWTVGDNLWDKWYCRPKDFPGMIENNPKLCWDFFIAVAKLSQAARVGVSGLVS